MKVSHQFVDRIRLINDNNNNIKKYSSLRSLTCDLFEFLQKKARGQELLDLVFKNLDLVEKDYFGLQFMDTHQVSVNNVQ